MRKPSKPYDTLCTLTYDVSAEVAQNGTVKPGNYLATNNSWYLIQEARLVRGHTCRYRLTCWRANPAEIPLDAVILPLYWYPRKKSRKTRYGNAPQSTHTTI